MYSSPQPSVSILAAALPEWTHTPLLVLLVTSFLYTVYQFAFPKPLPGIPHHAHSPHRLLGDLPTMIAHLNQHGEVFAWLAKQTHALDSPVVQVFTRPFGKPWVLLGDYRESHALLTRRGREFDKSRLSTDIFAGVLPQHHVHFMTGSPEFKRNRQLVGNLVATRFLKEVFMMDNRQLTFGSRDLSANMVV